MADDDGQVVNFALVAVIIVLGVVGNTASFIVFYKGILCRTLACSIYFRCLAVVDTFVLLFPGLQLLMLLPPISIPYNHFNNFFCKISTYNVVFGAQVSAWIIVMVTVERTLTICRPLKFGIDSSFFRPYIKIASLILLFAASNVFYLVDNQMTFVPGSQSNDTNASTKNDFDTFQDNSSTVVIPGHNSMDDASGVGTLVCYPGNTNLSHIYTIISIGVLSFIMPLLINLTCNVIMLCQLKHRLRDCSSFNSGTKTPSTRQAKLKNLMYRVLAISFVHCVSTGPVAALILVDYRLIPPYAVRLFNTLYYVNSGVNFLLYSATGKDFRQDFVELFLCKKGKRKVQRAYAVS